MRYLITLAMALWLQANPITLMDGPSGFYENNTRKMIPIYENITCKDEEVINQIPAFAICIIALERHKNGKARIEYKGQQGWVDVRQNPDDIMLMSDEELEFPMAFACSQVGAYFFEIKSVNKEKPVRVYEKPSTKSKVIASLHDHKSCLINLGCEWPWCRIDFGKGEGWALSINLTDQLGNINGYCYPRETRALTIEP